MSTKPVSQRGSHRTVIDESDPLMTVNDVAAYCRVHRAAVYRWMDKGLLPWTTVGTRRRVRQSDLLRYLELDSEVS